MNVIVCASALRGTLLDDWFFGVRLETGAGPRSTNVTFGDDTSTKSPVVTVRKRG